MTKRDGLLQPERVHAPLAPTELPLRPLCPACGADRVALRTQLHVTFEVVAAAGLGDELQVIDHRLEGCGWDDDDIACCERCGWRGRAGQLRARHDRSGA
jgi:hypothetical protein